VLRAIIGRPATVIAIIMIKKLP